MASTDDQRGTDPSRSGQDGGGHIDKRLPPVYVQIKEGIMTVEHRDANGSLVSSFQIPDIQLADLRHMAWQVLNSPELAALLA